MKEQWGFRKSQLSVCIHEKDFSFFNKCFMCLFKLNSVSLKFSC